MQKDAFSRYMCVCVLQGRIYEFFKGGVRAGILRGGFKVLKKASPWELSYWQAKK